jgi:hypothetical protein
MELPSKDIQCIDNALFIEHNVQRIITQQEQTGVFFNKERAHFFTYVLQERQGNLYRKIRPNLSMELHTPFSVPITRPFLKSGGYSNSTKKWYGTQSKDLSNVSGPFTRIEYVEPDLGKRKRLITQLLSLGWRPANFTEKGSPKLTVDGQPCKSLLKINSKIGRWIADWYTYRHREGQINGLIKRLRKDNRISAAAITIGTPTYRFRHKNVVNIPRVTSLFGKQMRSLFCVPNYSRRFVGYDASGIELRMLAHYINDTEYTKTVVEGKQEDGTDVHTRNQQDAGLLDRDTAKTFIYAFIYGAGDGKIGAIARTSRRGGQRIKENFLKRNPKLKQLIEGTERAAKRGYIVGLDGRRLIIRKDKFTGKIQTHKALNTLLQGAGAIVMKWSMVLLDEWIRQYKLDALKIIDMHDEGQQETSIKDADMTGRLAVMSIKTAGELLQLNVPLDGEYKVGLNWSHTH